MNALDTLDSSLFIVPADCSGLEVIAQGKRGIVFKATYKDKPVAIKIPRPSSDAPNTMGLEATYLKKVNKLGIGPKLILADEHYVVMEFIDGVRIGEFLANVTTTPQSIITVLNLVLEQLFTLDAAGINKYELTNPYKHIIITTEKTTGEEKPVLIDFERARHAAKPKNITQFVEYLKSKPVHEQLLGLLDYEQLSQAMTLYQETKQPFILQLPANDQETQAV
jgi:predicted Ser/Thr protein kinase